MSAIDRIRDRAKARREGSYLGRIGAKLCSVQGDQSIANQAGAAFRADLNTELQALVTLSSGATAPSTTYAHQLWVDTTANVIKKRNAANSGWIVKDTIDESFILSRASNTILALSDRGKTILATAGFTQTLTAAATLGDGWCCYFVNTHATAACTIDPNGAETINGAATQIVPPGCGGFIVCNGSAFRMTIAPQIDSTGNLIFAADATYDLGASGATRPRDGYFSRNLTAGSTVTGATVTATGTVNGATVAATGKSTAVTSFAETDGHTSIANGGTFDVTIPNPRRYQFLVVQSSANLFAGSLYLVHGDNSSTIQVNSVYSTGAQFTAAGQTANTVRITNSSGITADIYWSLLPLAVGL